MSERQQKRSRCAACREATRNQPTRVLRREKFNRFGMWVPGEAVLCDCCQETWWSLFKAPDAAVTDWIGLVDGRMWSRREVAPVSPGVQQLLRDIDLARQTFQESTEDPDDASVSWEPSP